MPLVGPNVTSQPNFTDDTLPRDVSFNEWAAVCHAIAVNHGWWPEGGRNFGECLHLVTTELCESFEEYRSHKPLLYFGGDKLSPKPEGIAVELIDAIIRIFDLLGAMGADVEYLMRLKCEYNKTRPFRHGDKGA